MPSHRWAGADLGKGAFVSWRWEIVLTDGQTINVVADEADVSRNRFFDFTNVRLVTKETEHSVTRGIWPFSRKEIAKATETRTEATWVTSINADHVRQITPVEEVEDGEQ
jgi:hypothetical protein